MITLVKVDQYFLVFDSVVSFFLFSFLFFFFFFFFCFFFGFSFFLSFMA